MAKRGPDDEEVNGPKVAAEILNRMSADNRNRIVRNIQDAAPEIAVKIEENLFTFNDLVDLTPQGIQTLLKEVDHKDVVISLKRASEAVRDHLFENMSERKRDVVRSDFDALPAMQLSEIEQAQRRILAKVDELRTKGLIRSNSNHSVWV